MTKPYILPFILVLFCSYTLSAQSALRDGKDYAIFFYCTSFDNGWTALPETEEEVKAIGALLQSDYGFQPHYIKNPSKADIKNEIAKWNARVRPNDQVLYFFSTHGYYDATADEGFLVPHNGKLRDTYGDTWLSYAELGRRVTKCRSKHVLLALDACYSGAFGDRFKGEPGGTPWEADADCADQVERALAYPTRLYFTSGSKEQRTPARSLFARRWLTALRQGQEKGVVRMRDLRYHMGSIETPKPEDGSFTGHGDGGFVFVHRSACQGRGAVSSNTDGGEVQLWAQAQQLNTVEAYAFYLQMYPNGRYRAQAQAKINQFELEKRPRKIRGKVTDDRGNPLIRAYLYVPGGDLEVQTDHRGAFELELPYKTKTIEISKKYYLTEVVRLSNQESYNVVLKPDPDQGIVVSGTVVDKKGQPLIGANVLVKGSHVGTATDLDGSFSLTLPHAAEILIFSYTGYKRREIPIAGQTEFRVVLK